MNILIIGCGYVGTALGEQLIANGHSVWGLRRSHDSLPQGFSLISCDLADLGQLKLIFTPDYIFFMPSAGKRDLNVYDAVYTKGVENLVKCLNFNNVSPRRIFYISSTSVYSQNNGELVNETSQTNKNNPYAACLINGENILIKSGLPSTVVRFGGIYGPERQYIVNQIINGTIKKSLNTTYINNIHKEDCVGILYFLMQLPYPKDLYLGVDNEPSIRNTVIEWISKQYNLQAPETDVSAEQNIRGGNKRCSNKLILSEGYNFKYPSFREGYLKLHGK